MMRRRWRNKLGRTWKLKLNWTCDSEYSIDFTTSLDIVGPFEQIDFANWILLSCLLHLSTAFYVSAPFALLDKSFPADSFSCITKALGHMRL